MELPNALRLYRAWATRNSVPTQAAISGQMILLPKSLETYMACMEVPEEEGNWQATEEMLLDVAGRIIGIRAYITEKIQAIRIGPTKRPKGFSA